LKLSEECRESDNGDAEMQSEVCFEFADVGKVKHEPEEKEEEEESCAQNKEENIKEQEENLPEMGFVHQIINIIATVI
jgi:hypothetical protein